MLQVESIRFRVLFHDTKYIFSIEISRFNTRERNTKKKTLYNYKQVNFRVLRMAEIDTAAPFASVRDAISMFGEYSSEKIQRAFLTTHELQSEKIHCLESELHRLQEEHANTKNQLLIAKTSGEVAVKELDEIKNVLNENNKKENDTSLKISLLELELHAMQKHETQRLQDLECSRDKIKNLHDKLKHLDFQHKTTLDISNRVQEENKKYEDKINKMMCKHEEYIKEQDNMATERMKGLLEDLYVTKEMLAKTNVAHANVEEEFRIFRIRDLESAKEEEYNSTLEIERMKNKLQIEEDQQEELILVVEKLKDELTTAKDSQNKALQVETDANMRIEKMKIEVEESKIAKEKAKVLEIQLEAMNFELKSATQEEQNLLASLASLKIELENNNEEIHDVKNKTKEAIIEMEEHINQLQTDLNVAIVEEAKAKEGLSNLNEALQQVTVEAIEAKATTTQAIEEVIVKTQELEEATLHNQTLECQLKACLKENEAAKASEIFAHTEVKFFKKKANNNIDINENRQDVTITYNEYKVMTQQMTNSEDVAKKRIAAALAQVDAAKASELEISKKLESVKTILERSQTAMQNAVQVAKAAEMAKFSVEEELRKWRFENEQRRKAAVAAVMAVGNNNKVPYKCIPLANGNNNNSNNNPHDLKTPPPTKDSNGSPFNGSPISLKPKPTLAQVLRSNLFLDKKTKPKKKISRRVISYFKKNINQKGVI